MKKRSDGRYRRIVNGITFYGKTAREVERKILEYTAQKEKGRTFEEVAREWWREAYDQLSPTSIRGYRVAYQRAVAEMGEMYLNNITAAHVSLYFQKLAKKNFAKSTVKNHKIVLNRIFNYALINGYINNIPSQGVEIPRGLKVKRRTAASVEDEERIRNTADVWVLPYLALMTGMRKGELLALKWGDIDFEKNTISVNKSLYYEGGAHIKSPKTEAGRRIVPLLSSLKTVLTPLRGNDEHYVISDDGEHPISQKRFRVLFKKYSETTGVTATLHQLRKSFATVAVQNNISAKVLQSIIGHKNISTTLDIYAEVRNDAIAEAGKILEKALK